MSTATAPAPSTVETIQSLYAAFGRGDIATILAALHPGVDWHVNVDLAAPGAAAVPTFQPRRGPQAVGEFFQELGSTLEFHSFQPVSFLAGGREVAVRVLLEVTVRATGKRAKFEAMHFWVLDAVGKVTRFVDFFDTLADADAWGAVKAAK
jgi:ketosteroid isomerase-like protein